MDLNRDWIELLQAFDRCEVRSLIVGAHARARYARPRATGDLDVWVERTGENATRVYGALQAFGAPLSGITVSDFTKENLVLQIGVAPVRIDILTEVDGLAFEDAWPNREEAVIEGVRVAFVGREDFIKNKRASGRTKDLADVEEVEKDRF